MKTPPFVSRSLPLLGHAPEFIRDRSALIRRGYQERGEVFGLKLGRQKVAILVGEDHARNLFQETDKRLDLSRSYSFLKPVIGNTSIAAGPEVYHNQIPLIYAPFTRKRTLQSLKVMNEVVQRWLDGLPEEGSMEIVGEMNRLVQDVAGYAFMGPEFQAQVGREFWDQYEAIGKTIDPVMPPNWPLPKFRRRDRALRRMRATLAPIIAERRAAPDGKYEDFFQDLVSRPCRDGQPLDEDAIQGMIIGTLLAGHETTAGQAAWTVIRLLQHTSYRGKVLREIAERFPYGSDVDARSLVQLKHIRWAIDETTRMHPSGDILIRYVLRDFETGGYVIPAGWRIFLGIEQMQQRAGLWTDPEQFDPLRFHPDRAEHKSHRHSITTFGGGVHKCAGMNFAQNEMLTIVARLFQQFHLELETTSTVTSRSFGTNRPSPTHIRFRRKRPDELVSREVAAEAAAAGCPHFVQH